jgi:hypothetical protein
VLQALNVSYKYTLAFGCVPQISFFLSYSNRTESEGCIHKEKGSSSASFFAASNQASSCGDYCEKNNANHFSTSSDRATATTVIHCIQVLEERIVGPDGGVSDHKLFPKIVNESIGIAGGNQHVLPSRHP